MSFPTLTNVRLRILSNTAGGDPATAQRQLEFKKSTDSVWRVVTNLPVSSPSIAQTATTDGTTTATTCAVNIPVTGLVAGDLLLVLFRTAGNATVSWPDAGWVELFENATDAGSGPTVLAWRKATGAETGSINVTTSVTGKFGALAWRITGAQDPTIQAPEFATLAIATTSTTPDPGTVTPTGGSKPYLFLAVMTSDGEATSPPGTFPTSYALNQIAAQSGTGGAVTTNVRLAGAGRQATVTSENPSTFSISAAPAGSTATTIAIHPAPLAAIQLATSGNIVGSAATATTAQLSAPVGQTFSAGNISDDTNPLPTRDLPTNGYTEDEWCLQATATALVAEVYQFRVTLAGTALTTYSQTPTWTIGAAPSPGIRDVLTRLRLAIRAYEDVTTRLRLAIRGYKDVTTRLRLAIRGYKDVASRLKLVGSNYRDVTTRLRLSLANPGVRDALTRLKLSSQASRDVAARLKLGVRAFRDPATRVTVHIRTYRDAATRLRLTTAAAYRDTRSRLVLQGGPGQLLVTFTAPTLDENGQPLPGDLDGFLVYYGTSPGVYGPPIDIGHITTYLLTGLIHGTTYYVAIRSYDTFGNQSALSAESSRAADPIGTLYPHGGDVATRFRLAISTPRDIFTRLKLAARQWVHVATRLTLQMRGFRDAATRLKLTGRGYKDAASRLVLTGRVYRDTSIRLKLSARAVRDAATRLTLTGRGYKDVLGRLRLAIASAGMRDTATRVKLVGVAYRDVANRLKLSVPVTRDVATRLSLNARAVKDIPTRLRLGIQTYRDTTTRVRLGIRQYRDIFARVTLGIRAYRDVASRVKIGARQYADISTRIRLAIANAGIRDAATRVRLRASATCDTATRLVLGIRAYRDAATRLKLTGRGFRDAVTRLKLTGRAFANVASRLVFQVRAYRDTATRLRLLRRGYRDVSTRFKLQLLQTPGWRDVQARFVLALPQLAPSLVFASLAQPAALVSTVNLLAWAAVSTSTALESEARVFLFAATAQTGRLVSTLDLLTWASVGAPSALVSDARGGTS